MDSIRYIQNNSENMTQHRGFKFGKDIKNTAVPQQHLLKSTKDTLAQKRTFGDISNRVSKTLGPNSGNSKETVKEKPIKLNSGTTKEKSDLKAAKPVDNFWSPFPEPDFRPTIIETEDYRDILPPDCVLSDETIKKFVRFWNPPKCVSEDDCPPSPTYSFELDSPFPCNGKNSPLELLPVEDNWVLDLPPPLWEN